MSIPSATAAGGAEMSVSVIPVHGIPEITEGADLAGLIAEAATGLGDGDILAITSKIVSKAEGRVVRVDREQAIDAESVRVIARRGATRIVETRHGLVLAAAGVDASNTPPGTVVLLPEDPDGSARRLRKALMDRLGVRIGVVVTDTLGRPWRAGQTDAAIGAAGVAPLRDYRGRPGQGEGGRDPRCRGPGARGPGHRGGRARRPGNDPAGGRGHVPVRLRRCARGPPYRA